MEKDLVKMFLTKDAKQRVKIYRDENAENPRYMTDEPLHCEDWNRDYSIMTKEDRENKSSNARDLCEHFLLNFGKHNKILSLLVENGKHMTDGKSVINNALVYEPTLHAWVLKEYSKTFYEKDYSWGSVERYECKKDNIDIVYLLESLLDSTIDYFIEQGCLTDEVKAMSYSFGYNGDVYFSEGISTDSVGIAWLEKYEFLKYSGCKEDYWEGKSLREIEFLIDELEAWSDNEVYGFVVEEGHGYKVHKECVTHEEEPQDYEEVEWEETDSCWGYYGELSKNLEYILSEAGFEEEELDEIDC